MCENISKAPDTGRREPLSSGIQEGSPEAKDILIERNLRLVAHIVKKYQGAPEELDDLISIGTIGLIKAVQTFDANKANRLSTYAARCIDNPILSQKSFYNYYI